MDKYRLKSSALKAQVITLEAQRAQKEEAGDELQPVDLEALKIEGVHRAEKVEERNAELLRLKKSAGQIQKVRSTHRGRCLAHALPRANAPVRGAPETERGPCSALIASGGDRDQEGAGGRCGRGERAQGGEGAPHEADGGVGRAAAEPRALQGCGAAQVPDARAQRHGGQAPGAFAPAASPGRPIVAGWDDAPAARFHRRPAAPLLLTRVCNALVSRQSNT